jgi:hypothetical protein
MVDGLTMFLESIGRGTNGPDCVFFHEYAHHIQFAKDLPQLAEWTVHASRYIEPMADAFAAYFGRHSHGSAIPLQSRADFVKDAYGIRDCYVDSVGHHVTPNQRAAAVAFAALQFDTAKNKTRILSSASLIDRFNGAYPYIKA